MAANCFPSHFFHVVWIRFWHKHNFHYFHHSNNDARCSQREFLIKTEVKDYKRHSHSISLSYQFFYSTRLFAAGVTWNLHSVEHVRFIQLRNRRSQGVLILFLAFFFMALAFKSVTRCSLWIVVTNFTATFTSSYCVPLGNECVYIIYFPRVIMKWKTEMTRKCFCECIITFECQVLQM